MKQVNTTQDLMVPMGSTLSVPTDKIAVKNQTDYCADNPIRFIDPDGRQISNNPMYLATKYVSEGGSILLKTNDGRNDVIVISDRKIKLFT